MDFVRFFYAHTRTRVRRGGRKPIWKRRNFHFYSRPDLSNTRRRRAQQKRTRRRSGPAPVDARPPFPRVPAVTTHVFRAFPRTMRRVI